MHRGMLYRFSKGQQTVRLNKNKSTERLREGDMNRWPYQSVLRLVFNLDTEGMKSKEGA